MRFYHLWHKIEGTDDGWSFSLFNLYRGMEFVGVVVFNLAVEWVRGVVKK